MTKFFKVVGHNRINNGFHYRRGLNVDFVPFNPTGSCVAGGLHFTTPNNLFRYLYHGPFVAEVTVPRDALIYRDPLEPKFKADKLFVNSIQPLKKFHLWKDLTWCRNVLMYYSNPSFVRYFDLSEDDWKILLRDDQSLLRHIPRQTYNLCNFAVALNGASLIHVKRQTFDICKTAVQQFPSALRHVNIQQQELKEVALCADPFTLQFIRNQTLRDCMLAVAVDGLALKYARHQTNNICMKAVTNNGLALEYCAKQTLNLCLAAVQQNPVALGMCKVKHPRILLAALMHKQNLLATNSSIIYSYASNCSINL